MFTINTTNYKHQNIWWDDKIWCQTMEKKMIKFVFLRYIYQKNKKSKKLVLS